MKKIGLLIMGLLLAVVLATPAAATIVVPSTLGNMTNKSDVVVVGQVESMSSYWENQVIYTAITFKVSDYIKSDGGNTPETIELQVPGGQVGEIRFEMDEAPVFTVGEECLVFLKRSGDRFVVYGLYYGVNRVQLGADGTTKYVTGPVFSSGQQMDLDTQTMVVNPLPLDGEELSQFRQRIIQVME